MEELLADIVKEGQLKDDVEEKDNSKDSQSEKKSKEEKPSHRGEDDSKEKSEEKSEKSKDDSEDDSKKESNTDDEKNVPFHKHPRWKELQKELKAKEKEIEELKSFKGEVNEKFSKMETKEKVPKWFSELYGENQEAWEAYSEHNATERKKMKQEILDEINQEKSKENERVSKWNNWVSDEIQKLKDEGLKFDKNKLMKIAVDYKPTDEEGNIDFKKAYEILQFTEKKTDNASKKKIADDTINNKPESKKEDFQTAHTLRNMGW